MPVAAGGVVLAAAPNGTVVCVDARSGALRWQVNVGRSLVQGIGSDAQTHVVVTRDAQLVSLDAQGKSQWSSALGAAAASVPVVGLDTAVVRTIDGRIQAFDTSNGKRRWQVSRQPPALVLQQTNAMAISPALVYSGLPGGRLVALSLTSGAVRWEAAVSQPRGANEIERISDVTGSPLLSGNQVCAASYQGRVACFDADTGRALWAQPVSSAWGLEIDPRFVTVVTDNDRVIGYSREGEQRWSNDKLRLRSLTGALSLGRWLLVGDGAGLVHVLERDTGEIVGRGATDGSAILATPIAAPEGLAIVQTRGGSLVALSAGQG
jgi:outer membrane protein assembly factor BamB